MNTIKQQVQNPAQKMSNGISDAKTTNRVEKIETLVIGGGQAGLSIGYLLAERKLPFLILDASERIGDAWRKRWDSLRLFSPARYNGLPGMPFPASPDYFPTKDEMADFLENYARHFNLPVRNGVRVDHLTRQGNRFFVKAGEYQFEAKNVVVAMASYQKKRVPSFANRLNPEITQLHSSEYRNPSQLQEGDVLIVGAGNSGSEIGMEVVRTHRTWMAGRDTGHIPFRIETRAAKKFFIPFVLRLLFHRVMTIHTWAGRKMRQKMLTQGGPLVRVKPKDMINAGIKRIPRVKDIKNGLPLLEDGRVLIVKNVIWSTGYHAGFSWIDLPVFGDLEPRHRRGIVPTEPGMYFLGLHFLYAASSSMVQGLERDAKHIVENIVSRQSGRIAKDQMKAPSLETQAAC